MKRIIGLMSGTSVDGIDAALVTINENKELKVNVEAFISCVYDSEIKREILECSNPETGTVDKICALNFKLAHQFVKAVSQLMLKSDCNLSNIDLIASHGHTVYHQVRNSTLKSTLQLGCNSVIAEKTGITTIGNFRVRDLAAGGEGAPLVPYADYLIYRSDDYDRVLQNVGGIGNYTYLPAGCHKSEVEGTDTGPGNMLIDGVINELSGGELNYDQDGSWAARGEVADTLLEKLMDHFFIKKEAPKTTGREDFGQQMVKKIIEAGKELALNKYDLVATVTAYTAYSIVDAYHRFIDGEIDQIIVGGGGSYNPVLIDMLRDYAREILSSGVQIITQEDLGYSSEAKEAVAFAVLGYQALRGKTNNLPRVTGASREVIMGEMVPGSNFYNYFDWQE